MDIGTLITTLEDEAGDRTIQVEINGVVHDIHSVTDDSQGVYLVVDLDIEEREMR